MAWPLALLKGAGYVGGYIAAEKGVHHLLSGGKDPEKIQAKKLRQRQSAHNRAMGMIAESESVRSAQRRTRRAATQPMWDEANILMQLLGTPGLIGSKEGSPERLRAALDTTAGKPGLAARVVQGSDLDISPMLAPYLGMQARPSGSSQGPVEEMR